METINGYTIIAEHVVRPNERVILAMGEHGGSVEYVTARARLREERPTDWYWGHYYGGAGRSSVHFLDAVADFRERTEGDQP